MTFDSLLSARDVRKRLRIGNTTLHRWLSSPEMRFPRPVRINGRRFFPRQAIEEWETGITVRGIDPGLAVGMRAISSPFQTYEDFIAALRKRREQLQFSLNTLDEVAGLQNGYAAKIEMSAGAPGKASARGLGRVSMPLVLGGLSCALVLIELPRRQAGKPRQ